MAASRSMCLSFGVLFGDKWHIQTKYLEVRWTKGPFTKEWTGYVKGEGLVQSASCLKQGSLPIPEPGGMTKGRRKTKRREKRSNRRRKRRSWEIEREKAMWEEKLNGSDDFGQKHEASPHCPPGRSCDSLYPTWFPVSLIYKWSLFLSTIKCLGRPLIQAWGKVMQGRWFRIGKHDIQSRVHI